MRINYITKLVQELCDSAVPNSIYTAKGKEGGDVGNQTLLSGMNIVTTRNMSCGYEVFIPNLTLLTVVRGFKVSYS